MSRFINASQSPDCPAQAPADDALWAELYFPRVEDLLRRLASAEKEKRYSLHALLFGRWPVTAGLIVALIGVPGCATGAIVLMATSHIDPAYISTEEPTSAKADRLALVETKARHTLTPTTANEISPPLMALVEEAALPDGIALRGTLQSAALTTAVLPQPAPTAPAKPAKRIAARPVSLKPPAEHPEAAPPPQPSLLQKLFGMIVPVTQASQQPVQRQT